MIADNPEGGFPSDLREMIPQFKDPIAILGMFQESDSWGNQRNAETLSKYLGTLSKEEKQKAIEQLLEAKGSRYVALYLEDFSGLPYESVAQLMPDLIDIDLIRAIAVNKSFTPSPVPELARFSEIVGPVATTKLYKAYLESGEDQELFKEKVSEARAALFESDTEALSTLAEDPLLRDIAESVVRFTVSEWGEHREEEFKEMVDRYLEHKDSYAPLPEGYKPGKIETFKQRKSKEAHAYSPEFTERWKALIPALQASENLVKQPEKLRSLYRGFLSAISAQKAATEESLTRAPNEIARASLQKRLAELDSIDVHSEEGMADAFNKLYDRKKSPELNDVFRKYGFYVAHKQMLDTGAQPPSFASVSVREPSPEDISRVIEFVQHIAHQETWERNEAFANKEAQEGLSSLFHVKALENELVRFAKASEKGEAVSLDVIPSRDILTEFSGHIADACWASRFEILKEFPQITSLTFMQEGRPAGACLLIDTTLASGEEITIIRGLNPLEAVINKLDIESFVDSLKEYMEGIAKERERRVAIAIDESAGMATTNRPLLFQYLAGLKRSLTLARGLNETETTFNAYNITDKTYYL
jgi:hypothetical protein